jgi:chloride channel 3/4/5
MSWISSDRVWSSVPPRQAASYDEADSIDWPHETEKERIRTSSFSRWALLQDSAATWLVVILTGVLVGFVSAYLDVVSTWLSDLRQGICVEDAWLDSKACCAGLDRVSRLSRP